MFIYPIYNHSWRNISTIYIYIKRLASNEIFSQSNKIHREVSRAKVLSAPCSRSFLMTCLYRGVMRGQTWYSNHFQGSRIPIFIITWLSRKNVQYKFSKATPPHFWRFHITRNDAPQAIRLLWTSDQLVAESYTWQHTTLITDRHPCPRRDTNPQSQQASCLRPTLQAARPTGVSSKLKS